MNGSAKSPPSVPNASSPPRSSFLPSATEGLLLAAFPTILIMGSLYGHLSIDSTISPYDPIAQAHMPTTAPSYFARKDNAFNQYFVKVGWFWSTLGFWALHLLTAPTARTTVSTSSRSVGTSITTPEPPARLVRALARWSLATLLWFLTTQWFFGPALIDRSFTLSGGVCDLSRLSLPDTGEPLKIHETPVGPKGLKNIQDIASGVACKAAGGVWRGGHDISGHVFLLILGSGMLLLEALPVVLRSGGKVAQSGDKEGRGEREEMGTGAKIALGIAGLKAWMLLMTAAYFHTWFEKFTGLLVASAGLWLIYLLPRGVAGVRGILGVPVAG